MLPSLVQLERQARLTLALLPHIATLPWVDDEALVRTFGQAMATLNWIPEAPTALMEIASRRKRTQEEQRDYWRRKQREYRKRKREE